MGTSRSRDRTWRRSPRALPRGGRTTLLEHPAPRQDRPRTGQGRQGQDTTSGQSGAGFRTHRRGGRHVGNLSTHWEHVRGTLCTAIHYPRWGTPHHSPSAPHEPMGSHGELGASSAPGPTAQAARSTRMRAKSSMAARTCDTRSPASATAAAAASPSMPAWARRCRVPSRTASSRPSRPSTA